MAKIRGIPRHFRFPWRSLLEIHRQVDEELQFHLDCRIEELLESGYSQEEAEQITHREFGDLKGARSSLKAQGRRHEAQLRRQIMFSELFRDIKYAWRSLMRSPGFTAVAVLVLALGIGAGSTIFSLVNIMMMRPIQVENPDQLVGVYSQSLERPDQYSAFSYPTYIDLRQQNDVFEQLAAYEITMVGLKQGETTRRVMAGVVSSNYFRTFGKPPARGREFTVDEETTSSADVAVVSHDFWLAQGSTGVLGSTLVVNGRTVTVVGIAQEGFTGSSALFSPQIWLPLGLYEAVDSSPASTGKAGLSDRENNALMLFGRLAPEFDEQSAAPRLAALAGRLEAAYPKAQKDQTFITSPLPRLSISTAPDNESYLLAPVILLLAMAGVVLLIACLNLANMFLARGAGRRTELAIRLSLGGGRLRLVRQLLSEGLVLSLMGGAVGLVFALYGTRLLLGSINALLPFGMDIALDTAPDWRVLLATLFFCLMATVLSGLGPAWKLSGANVISGLKENAGQGLSGGGKAGRMAPRNLMVLAQIALSMMLLSAGGLFVRGALVAADANPGFSLRNSVLVELDTSLVGYDQTQGKEVYRRALERLRSLPGVESAAISSIVPFGTVSRTRQVRPAGDHDDESAVRAHQYVVSDDYFESLRLPLLQGRGFTAAETTSDTGPRIAIISRPLAEQLWPGESPVGKILQIVSGDSEPPAPVEIVGLSPGIRHQLSDQQPVAHLYMPFGQNFSSNMHVHLRLNDLQDDGGAAEASLMQSVRKELRALDPLLPILSLKTYSQFRDQSIFLWLLDSVAKIFTGLGLVALFLALVGVYGVKAFMVTSRTREIGLRLALGATPSEILKQMVRENLSTTFAALLLGSLLALGAAKVAEHLIYESQRGVIPIILGAGALLALASTLAAYLPARRATRIEPTVALRQG